MAVWLRRGATNSCSSRVAASDRWLTRPVPAREPPNRTRMFNDKSILITGGTGSFGKQYAKTILQRYRPRKLIIYSRDELKQFEMQEVFCQECMRFFIGDVRDRDRLVQAMRGVDVVIHAAALK